jgi:1-acyl-sn-glycerol-3-phosphate acyltransferase
MRRLPFPFRAAPVPDGVEPPERSTGRGADFETDWARRYPARMARLALLEGVIRPAARVLADPQRRGADRLDDLEGPAVFVANHHSHLDTGLMLTSIPEPWRHKIVIGAAADYFFTTRASSTAAALALNAIPIERTKVNRRSARLAEDLLNEGWSLLIFPEGGRSPDGWGQPFRGGAAYMALRTGLPIGAHPRHLRPPDPTGRGRRRPVARTPHRTGGGGARRRVDDRLVHRPGQRPHRRHAPAHRPRRPQLAAGVGARRPEAHPQAPRVARPGLTGTGRDYTGPAERA